MFPIIFRVLRTYAPYITLPAAALIGIIGYNIENLVSDKYTPYQESISKKRTERLLNGPAPEDNSKLSDTIFDKNLSPSLQSH